MHTQVALVFLHAVQFWVLPPTDQADERYPGVINVPVQITLDPVTTVLQNDVGVFVTIVGGTATGKGFLVVWCMLT